MLRAVHCLRGLLPVSVGTGVWRAHARLPNRGKLHQLQAAGGSQRRQQARLLLRAQHSASLQHEIDSIYDHPELYEVAFGFRNIPAEVQFLIRCMQRHSDGQLQSALELGCGPASHSLELADSGVAAVALDCSERMLEHAAGAARKRGAGCQLVTCLGDMQAFDLSGYGEQQVPVRVDLTCCLLGTVCHLLDNGSALRAFACVFKALRPGGLFIVELEHPEHLYSGCLMDMLGPEARIDTWSVDRPGNGGSVDVQWGDETDVFDPVSEVMMRRVSITVKGSDGNEKLRVEEVVAQRMWSFQQIALLAQVSGFEIVASYGAMDDQVELEDDEEAFRMVLVMKRVPEDALSSHRWLEPGQRVFKEEDEDNEERE